MSRQNGEGMMSYVSRRRRWWKMLKSMDNSIELSATIRGDLMLEASGLSADQQLMVLTSINNEREFDRLATALMEQHPKIHLSDRRQHDDRPSGGYKGGKRGSKGGYRRYANFGAEEDEEDDDYEEEDEPEADDDEEAENETVDDVELDVFTCMACQEAEPEDIATMVQVETTAFAAWDRFGKGKARGKGKGKGKRKGKRPRFSQGMKPNLSLDERKAALKKLKSETKCMECGEKGHWANDPECKKK